MGYDDRAIYGYTQEPHLAIVFEHNPRMDIAKVVGENLSAWMHRNPSLDTIKKVEAKSGIGFGTIRRARNGDGNITIEKLAAIAAAFRRHPAELLIEDRATAPPRLADYRIIEGSATVVEANEPKPAEIHAFPQPLLRELQAIAERINDAGLQRLIERANALAEQFPREASKGNTSS